MDTKEYADIKKRLKAGFTALATSKLEYISKLSNDLDNVPTQPGTNARFGKLMIIFCATTRIFYSDKSINPYPTSRMRTIFFHKGNYDILMGIAHEDDAVEAAVLIAVKTVEELVKEERTK